MNRLNQQAIRKIASSPRLFLFLDFDGTLSPIARTPERAFLPKEFKKLLKKLNRLPAVKLAIISGRRLSDLEKIVRLKGITYAGNHGLEIKIKQRLWVHPSAERFPRLIKNIATKLQRQIRSIKGVAIENKGLGLSLHYRLVPKAKISLLYSIFRKVIKPWIFNGSVRLARGKKVWELKPSIRWNKGSAVLWLARKYNRSSGDLIVYVGDDETDEDAFKVLRHKGLTFKVGEKIGTRAQRILGGRRQVWEVLNHLFEIRRSL